MEPLKKDAINIITNLKYDADIKEIIYRLYVMENNRRGQKDAEKDKTTPMEQIIRYIQIG